MERRIKIYKTQEEKEEFYKYLRNRILLQEKLHTLSQIQNHLPTKNTNINLPDPEFKISLS